MAFYSLGNSSFTRVFRNLFGGGFFKQKNSYLIGQDGPVWLNTEKPYELYNSIPQLRTVIEKKAMMFSNMEIKLVDKNGAVQEDIELARLLENPNCMQSQNEFLRQYKIQEQVYGNQFLYKNKPSQLLKYPIALWPISPSYMTPVMSGVVFDQIKKEDVIKNYKYNDGKVRRLYETQSILYSRIPDLDNPLIGMSPIVALKYPLTNTEKAYEYRNVIMAEKGAIGMLSNKSKDSQGAMPLTQKEKEKIEKTYLDTYGIDEGKRRVLLTEASLEWQPMTYPTKDMLLFEEIDANMLTIIDLYGLNVNIFSNKSSTYENVKQGIVGAYQDTIIPEADLFMQSLTEFLQIPSGLRLVASYEHLSIMKENKQKGMAALNSIVMSLDQAVKSGLIAPPQAINILANELGITPDPQTSQEQRINSINRLSPLVANAVLKELSKNETRDIVNGAPVTGGDEVRADTQTNFQQQQVTANING